MRLERAAEVSTCLDGQGQPEPCLITCLIHTLGELPDTRVEAGKYQAVSGCYLFRLRSNYRSRRGVCVAQSSQPWYSHHSSPLFSFVFFINSTHVNGALEVLRSRDSWRDR